MLAKRGENVQFALVNSKDKAALLIVGHGSTVNPSSSTPTLMHAATIRDRGLFADVACCFWKEEPSLRDALFFFRDPAIREVYVVPNFISEGYFTRTVIPRELELSGPETERPGGQTWKYCEPVGSHESMTEHLLSRAREIAPGVDDSEAALLIVAHGTSLNDNSAVAAKEQAEKIRQRGRYSEVLNVYMEESPLVSDWATLTKSKNVVVVPFFISDGLHSYEDIPALLGMDRQTEGGNCEIQGRSLFYSTAIGTDSRFAEVIIEQAMAFDRKQVLQSAS
jgi:sirohydrochlorin cobaltochelatase